MAATGDSDIEGFGGEVPAGCTRFIVVRHGQTPWNKAKNLQGFSDSDLSDLGVEQAKAAGSWLAGKKPALACVYSSDLTRALHTAKELASACGLPEPTTDTRLRETNLGVVQGISWADTKVRHDAFVDAFHCDCRVVMPGGEGEAAKHARIMEALADIAAAHVGQAVGVVVHGGVVREVQRAANGTAVGDKMPGRVPNASISVFQLEHAATPTPMPCEGLLYSEVVPDGTAACREAYEAAGHPQTPGQGLVLHGCNVLSVTEEIKAVRLPVTREQWEAEDSGAAAGAAVTTHSALLRSGQFSCLTFGLTGHMTTVT